MEEIKDGEYIRTDNGEIYKAIDVEKGSIKIETEYKEWIGICCIAKHSFNIIDLIEVGDYVNGFYVERVWEQINNKKAIDLRGDFLGLNDVEYIETIVTKEKFKNMEYEM